MLGFFPSSEEEELALLQGREAILENCLVNEKIADSLGLMQISAFRKTTSAATRGNRNDETDRKQKALHDGRAKKRAASAPPGSLEPLDSIQEAREERRESGAQTQRTSPKITRPASSAEFGDPMEGVETSEGPPKLTKIPSMKSARTNFNPVRRATGTTVGRSATVAERNITQATTLASLQQQPHGEQCNHTQADLQAQGVDVFNGRCSVCHGTFNSHSYSR